LLLYILPGLHTSIVVGEGPQPAISSAAWHQAFNAHRR
jgi:hypothetical protein